MAKTVKGKADVVKVNADPTPRVAAYDQWEVLQGPDTWEWTECFDTWREAKAFANNCTDDTAIIHITIPAIK